MSLEKTWQISTNDLLISDASNITRAQRQVWWYYDFLTRSNLTGKWTILGSSNGTTAGMDGVDRWGRPFNASNLVYGSNGSAHSWIVLQSPVALGPIYVTIAYDKTGFYESVSWYFSYAAPTGGSTTQNPTVPSPSESYVNINNDAYGANYRFHGAMADDGSFIVAMGRDLSNAFNGFISVSKLSELRAGDGNGTVIKLITQTGGALSYANLLDDWRGRAPDGTQVTLSVIRPAYGSAGTDLLLGMNQDTTELKYLDWPAYLFVNTASKRSIKGRLPDIRLSIGGLASGTCQPSSGTPEKMVSGAFWLPANASPIM